MSNKKIWILNHYAITPTTGGGTRHYDFAAELVNRGYDVTIFAAGFDHKLRVEKLAKGEKVRKETVNGVNFVWLKTFPYQKNDKRRIINMFSFMFRLFFVGLKQEKPDVIVASSPHLLTCLTGYFLAHLKKAKYVVEIRDLWPQSAVDMGLISESGMTNKILKFVERFIYKKAKKIIVLLPGAVSYIKSLGIDENKVKYIPNGVDVKRYDQVLQKGEKILAVEQIRQKHENNFKVLYLGAHGQANVLDVIIEAAKIIQDQGYQDIHLLFVGDGPEKEHLIAKANTHGLNNIFFYQPIKKVEVPLLLDNVDIATISIKNISLLGKYGISPNKIFDYLCAGKPIIFAVTALNDIVKEANAGISIPPEDPPAFAQAIIDLYHLPKHERNLLGANGRRYVEEYHDIPVLVDSVIGDGSFLTRSS